MSENTFCPACGKAAPADASFCPACGARLPSAVPDSSLLPGKLRERYEAYDAWVQQALSRRNAGQIALGWLTGNDAFKRSEEHTRFLDDVQAMSSALLEHCRTRGVSEELPALLRYVLIDCHDVDTQETDWMYLAAEKCFAEFLPLLSPEAAAALYGDYRFLRRHTPGLQIQKNILKELKKIGKV